MRYFPVIGVASLLPILAACGSAQSTEPIQQSASPLTDVDGAAPAGATITFSADWQQTVSGALVAGEPITIAYDSARLPECGGDIGSSGGYATTPGWTDTAFYSLNGVPIGSFAVAGAGLTNGPPIFTPSMSGELQLWFQCTSVWGNSSWDSNYGANYTFTITAPANFPGWIGNASALLDRATCGSGASAGACYADAQPLDGGFDFGTWARDEALVTELFFDVWMQGVTDFPNPNLWQQLDVELHWRVKGVAAFTTQYVDFAEYTGNNARYAVNLRPLDLLPTPAGGPVTSTSQCPTLPTTVSSDGQLIEAAVELYFTVNGVPLFSSTGGLFQGTFANYAGLYAVCD